MVVLSQLTFWQEVWKEVAGAVATAVFVGLAAGLIVGRYNHNREGSRERAQVRRSLLDRSSEAAGTFWITCQHLSRVLPKAADESSRAKLIENLDTAYQEFVVQAVRIESEMQAWFGRATPLATYYASQHQPSAGECGSDSGIMEQVIEGTVYKQAWERWHQIRDLLTLYYFNLKALYAEDKVLFDVIHKNSVGYNDGFHSGLRLATPAPSNIETSEHRRTLLMSMRRQIRAEYESAFGYVMRAILEGKLATLEVDRSPWVISRILHRIRRVPH